MHIYMQSAFKGLSTVGAKKTLRRVSIIHMYYAAYVEKLRSKYAINTYAAKAYFRCVLDVVLSFALPQITQQPS